MRKKCANIYDSQKGYTLVELMVALVLSVVLIGAIFGIYRRMSGGFRSQELVIEMQENLRSAITIMSQEMRMACYDPRNSAGARIVQANATTFQYTSVADDDGIDNDGNGLTDEPNELKLIQYDLYDAYAGEDFQNTLDIGRQVGVAAATKRAIAENIETLQFYYTLADGTQSTAPPATAYKDIRSMQLSILARISHPDIRYTDTRTYTLADGTVLAPFNDNFRRRLFTKTIILRNMGM